MISNEEFFKNAKEQWEKMKQKKIEELKKQGIVMVKMPSPEEIKIHPYFIFSKN